ncbi:PAAR domain-containing protein [Salmonella enterica subsp. diarizonae]|nr:PAAR domain-containing protein [Salmonella enterica subsp. diarizonae]
MSKGIIRLHDKLSSGGEVISASSTMIIDGIKAALLNDLVSCPIYAGIGSAVSRSGMAAGQTLRTLSCTDGPGLAGCSGVVDGRNGWLPVVSAAGAQIRR